MGRGRRVADMDLSPGGWEGWKEAQRDADVGLWWTFMVSVFLQENTTGANTAGHRRTAGS